MLSVAAVLIMQQDNTEVVQEESFLPLVRPDDLAELHPSHDAEKFMDDESFWNIVHHDMQNPKLTAMMLKTHIASKTRKGGVSATKKTTSKVKKPNSQKKKKKKSLGNRILGWATNQKAKKAAAKKVAKAKAKARKAKKAKKAKKKAQKKAKKKLKKKAKKKAKKVKKAVLKAKKTVAKIAKAKASA